MVCGACQAARTLTGQGTAAALFHLRGSLLLNEDRLLKYNIKLMFCVYLNLQPVAKRACHPPSEEQYKAAVGSMEGALEAVKLLLQKGSPPGWLAVKLEALHAAMATLRDGLR